MLGKVYRGGNARIAESDSIDHSGNVLRLLASTQRLFRIVIERINNQAGKRSQAGREHDDGRHP